MRRALKWLFVLLLIGAALMAMSYAGARATAGKVVGSNPPLFERVIELNYRGVEDLPGTPRAWVISFDRTRLPETRRAVIYVSLTGKLIATRPADLDRRLEAYEKAREP
jgi:hypothetical protein